MRRQQHQSHFTTGAIDGGMQGAAGGRRAASASRGGGGGLAQLHKHQQRQQQQQQQAAQNDDEDDHHRLPPMFGDGKGFSGGGASATEAAPMVEHLLRRMVAVVRQRLYATNTNSNQSREQQQNSTPFGAECPQHHRKLEHLLRMLLTSSCPNAGAAGSGREWRAEAGDEPMWPVLVDCGIILFEEGKPWTHWYLLLSGEIELYSSIDADNNRIGKTRGTSGRKISSSSSAHAVFPDGLRDAHLATVVPGTLFGELATSVHSCSARVIKPSEFVKIHCSQFFNVYNKFADQLQPFLLVIEDLLEDRRGVSNRPPEHQHHSLAFSSNLLKAVEAQSGENNIRTTSSRHEYVAGADAHQHATIGAGRATTTTTGGGLLRNVGGGSARALHTKRRSSSHHRRAGHHHHHPHHHHHHHRGHRHHSAAHHHHQQGGFVDDDAKASSTTAATQHPHRRHNATTKTTTFAAAATAPASSVASVASAPPETGGGRQRRGGGEQRAMRTATISIDNGPGYTYVPPLNLSQLAHNLPTTSNADEAKTKPRRRQRRSDRGGRAARDASIEIDEHDAEQQPLYQLSNEQPLRQQIRSAALTLWRLMRFHSPWMFLAQQQGGSANAAPSGAMTGAGLCVWLDRICDEFLADCFRRPLDVSTFAAVWQCLLDWHFIHIARKDDQILSRFRDSQHALYRWAPGLDDRTSEFGAGENAAYTNNDEPTKEEVFEAIQILSGHGSATLFEIALQKPERTRTLADLQLIRAEMSRIAAFSRLSAIVQQQLARFVRWEHFEHAGTIVYRRGDPATSWYIVMHGEVCVQLLVPAALSASSSSIASSSSEHFDHDDGDDSCCNNDDDGRQRNGTTTTLQQHQRRRGRRNERRRASRKATTTTHPTTFYLCEGDDFGKLALLARPSMSAGGGASATTATMMMHGGGGGSRQATVATSADQTALLRIDNTDFEKIFYDVETATIRLKGHAHQPVAPQNALIISNFLDASEELILHRVDQLRPLSDDNGAERNGGALHATAHAYKVSAGTPHKVLEYLLETRMDAFSPPPLLPPSLQQQTTTSNGGHASAKGAMTKSASSSSPAADRRCCSDVLLEDFILTHSLFMPTNELCNALKVYFRQRPVVCGGGGCSAENTRPMQLMVGPMAMEECWAPRRRVVRFLSHWQHTLGSLRFHQDTVARSFIEELYCLVLDDVRKLEQLFASAASRLMFTCDYASSVGAASDAFAAQLEQHPRLLLAEFERLRVARDAAMRALNRRARVVLDADGALAEWRGGPVLAGDLFRLRVFLPPTGTFTTVQVPLDRTAAEIAQMARQQMQPTAKKAATLDQRRGQRGDRNDPHHRHQFADAFFTPETSPVLVEVRPNGQRLQLPNDEKSVPLRLLSSSSFTTPTSASSSSTAATAASTFTSTIAKNVAAGAPPPIFFCAVLPGDEMAQLAEQLRPLQSAIFARQKLLSSCADEQPAHHPTVTGVLQKQLKSTSAGGGGDCILEMFEPERIAERFFRLHCALLAATHETELLAYTINSGSANAVITGAAPHATLNLELLQRRFNELQGWTSAAVLLADGALPRVRRTRQLIKVARAARARGDLLTLFAVTLGLSLVPVSRLHKSLWSKIPVKDRRLLGEFEALLEPSRNHRAYRLYVSRMKAPYIPFLPLLLKDLTFICEGNRTLRTAAVAPATVANDAHRATRTHPPLPPPSLVNFEKMHAIGELLREFRYARGGAGANDAAMLFVVDDDAAAAADKPTPIAGGGAGSSSSWLSSSTTTKGAAGAGGGGSDEPLDSMIRTLPTIIDSKQLMWLSHAIESPPAARTILAAAKSTPSSVVTQQFRQPSTQHRI